MTLIVTAVNDAPEAAANSYSTDEDALLTGASPGVLGNDLDRDSSALTAALVTGPGQAASFRLNSDGSFSYLPKANYNGADSFTYRANDGAADSNVATVTINVNAVNDAPALDAIPDPAAILEDAGLQTINLSGISAGPADESGQELIVTAVSSDTSLIPDPTVSYTSPNATGSLSYTPVAEANGTATITVRVEDDGGTAKGGVNYLERTFTVTVTAVNDAPSFTSGGNVTVAEDSGDLLRGVGDGNISRSRGERPGGELRAHRRQSRPVLGGPGDSLRRDTDLHPCPQRQRKRNGRREGAGRWRHSQQRC